MAKVTIDLDGPDGSPHWLSKGRSLDPDARERLRARVREKNARPEEREKIRARRKIRAAEFNPDQERDELGQWTDGSGSTATSRKETVDRPSSHYTPSHEAGRDTQEKFRDKTTRAYTPERQELHRAVIDAHFVGNTPVEKPLSVMLGGGSAVGKSSTTLLQARALMGDNAVHLDVDEIKKSLPEYREKTARGDRDASLTVHEEASDISKVVIKEASGKSHNLILDGTGDSSIERLAGKVAVMRSMGQEVHGLYATLPVELALKLNEERGLKTGRFVPETVVRENHKAVSRTFPEAIRQGLFDKFELWDNRVYKQPKLVVSGRRKDLEVHDTQLWKEFLAKGGA